MGSKLDSATAADLNAAAQGHANATWGWGITAAVVWYFWGWGWAALPCAVAALGIFKSTHATLLAHKMERAGAANYGSYRDHQNADAMASRVLAQVESLVNSYGKVLEAVAGQQVADPSLLPTTKVQMKSALLLGIKFTPEGPQREHLKAGFLMLSAFQDGAGTEPHSELVAASLSEGADLLQELTALGV